MGPAIAAGIPAVVQMAGTPGGGGEGGKPEQPCERTSAENRAARNKFKNNKDAARKVTAALNAAGAVLARFLYTPFGQQTVYDANWNLLATSPVDLPYAFQGLRTDFTLNLADARTRAYDVDLERFLQQDSAGMVNGANLYWAYGNNPNDNVDPNGQGFWSAVASAARVVGGALEVSAGVAIVAATAAVPGLNVVGFVAGAVLIAHGADTAVTGVVGLAKGEVQKTLTNKAVTTLTGSETAGEVADIAIPIVAGGIGQVAMRKAAVKAAAAAAERQAAAAAERTAASAASNAATPIRGLCKAKYDLVLDVLNGKRPPSALKALTKEELEEAIKFYRGAASETLPGGSQNLLVNPDRIRRTVQGDFQAARAYFLEHGGQAPGTFNEYVIRNYPAKFIENELPQVFKYMQANPGLPRFGM